MQRAAIATSSNVMGILAAQAARNNPEAVTPSGRWINPVTAATAGFRSLNRFARATLMSTLEALQSVTQSQDKRRAERAAIEYEKVQNYLENLNDFERRQQEFLALAAAGYAPTPDNPYPGDLGARRPDRLALTYNAHGATAPAPPPRGSIFDGPSPFVLKYHQQKRRPPLPIEDIDPGATGNQRVGVVRARTP
jgi:hypothetical protein